MKVLFLLPAFCMSIFLHGQEEIFSVYFETMDLNGLDGIGQIDQQYHNKYQVVAKDDNILEATAGDYIFVDATGVYSERNQILSISREEVRENSQYLVRNNYIHGVVEGDSLPVALEKELYYFLLPVKSYLYEVSSAENSLFKLYDKGEYLVMEKEGDYYQALIFSFQGNTMELRELSLEEGYDLRTVDDSQKIDGEIPTYVVNPSADEWPKVVGCFEPFNNYTAVVE